MDFNDDFNRSFIVIFTINLQNISKVSPKDKWRPPSLSGLTPIIFNMELTNLGSKASIS